MRTPESEAHPTRRERQRQKERWEAEQYVRCRCRMEAESDEDVRLLEWVYLRSLTTTETNVWRLRRKNAKALCIAIEHSEREAAEAARLAKLKW
ncbi:Phosphorylated carbohydrates phosphatase [Hordeum vulgare]|nr:Phosphorylated carbohydrates phosphatase [Hordeum vulgare]